MSKRKNLYKSIMKKANKRTVHTSRFSKIPSVISNYWLILLAFITICAAWILVPWQFQIAKDSARLTIDTIVQAGAGIVAVLFAILALLWGQSSQARDQLRHYLLQYSNEFNPSMDINNLHVTLSMISRNKKLPEFAHTTVTNFLTNLVTLQAITKFHTTGKLVNASSLLPATLYDDDVVKNVKMRSEVFFYKKFPDDITFYNCLKALFKDINIIDYLLINDLNEKDYPGTDFNIVHKLYAVLIEFNLNRYINMSMNNITFYKRFIGLPLSLLVSLWAICLLLGILLMPFINTMSEATITYLTLIMVSLGIMASAITLSLILSSIRNTS